MSCYSEKKLRDILKSKKKKKKKKSHFEGTKQALESDSDTAEMLEL